jgi:hypothetical protein
MKISKNTQQFYDTSCKKKIDRYMNLFIVVTFFINFYEVSIHCFLFTTL